ncbi:hypothetical protein HY643_03090 [Candidatus Woesearchaeota archaeon]|nr:hypothetical protein [Candidatus Woesearchaeota archaeon]
MVKEAYICEECSLIYADKGVAEKCEAWCRKTKSCNIQIIKKAIGKLIKC